MSINSDIKRATDLVLDASEKVIRGTALALFSQIIKDSPTITGRLRGNWRTTLKQITSGSIERLDKSGNSALTEASGVVGNFEFGDTISFYNNLEYATFVEDGTKTQTGQFMVKRNVAAFEAEIAKQAKKHEVK